MKKIQIIIMALLLGSVNVQMPNISAMAGAVVDDRETDGEAKEEGLYSLLEHINDGLDDEFNIQVETGAAVEENKGMTVVEYKRHEVVARAEKTASAVLTLYERAEGIVKALTAKRERHKQDMDKLAVRLGERRNELVAVMNELARDAGRLGREMDVERKEVVRQIEEVESRMALIAAAKARIFGDISGGDS